MDLTVMTYNIRVGTWNPLGLEAIARVIERHQPDVVGLQEVHRYSRATGPVDQARWLGERLKMTAVFGPARLTDDPWPILPDQPGEFGNALLSRFAVRESAVHRLPRPGETGETRSLLAAALDTGGALNVFVTHWALLAEQRLAQAHGLVDFTRAWKSGPPVIIMGDFNALPDSPEMAMVRTAWLDAWEAAHVPVSERVSFPSGPRGSATHDGYRAAIDYVFVSPNVRVQQIEVLYDESLASDHNPVLARLSV